MFLLLSLYYWTQWQTKASPLPNGGSHYESSAMLLRDSMVLASEAAQCACPNLRSTFDIVWSCFSTLFICVWSSVHPNMKPPEMRFVYRALHRPGYMFLSLAAPELMILLAARQFFGALVLKKRYKASGWTMTHGFFLQMGGFLLLDADGKAVDVLYADVLEILLAEDRIDLPKVTADDIEDRSKSDGLAKGLAILQTTWFMVQCIARRVQHLPITQIELATVAFASLNGVMLGLWWYKPFDVKLPIPVQMRPPSQSSSTTQPPGNPKFTDAPPVIPNDPANNSKFETEASIPTHSSSNDRVDSEVADLPVRPAVDTSANTPVAFDAPPPVGDPNPSNLISTPPQSQNSVPKDSETFQPPNDQDDGSKISHSPPVDSSPCSVSKPITTKTTGSDTNRIEGWIDQPEQLKTDRDSATLDTGPSGVNATTSITSAPPLQTSDHPEQAMRDPVGTHQSLDPLPKAECHIDSLKKGSEDAKPEQLEPIKIKDAKDEAPQSTAPVFLSTISVVERPEPTTEKPVFPDRPVIGLTMCIPPMAPGRSHRFPQQVGEFYAMELTGSEQVWSGLITVFFAVLFGAVHAVGWNLAFPSKAEKIIWRIASVAHIVIPIILSVDVMDLRFSFYNLQADLGRGGGLHYIRRENWKRVLAWGVLGFVSNILMAYYLYARLYLLLETILSLRALPPATFEQVDWTNFIPHVSS